MVYMGHGNGWPSRYRDDLFPPTQNGFGLNPVAGGSDSQHQYFGEKYVGDQIKLAKNAVVLLHHLCYASGNTEPGLSEGTLARRSSGSTTTPPASFVPALPRCRRMPTRAGLHGPLGAPGLPLDRPDLACGPVGERPHVRLQELAQPGYVAQMDPDRSSSGFHRSIVLRKGLASKDVLANGRGAASTAANQTEERLPPSRP